MKRAVIHLLATSLLAGALVSPSSVYAADSTTKAQDKAVTGDKEAAPKAKRDWYPFHGFVFAVNKQANTISLKKKEGERVLKLDAKSTLEISSKPAGIGSVKVGDYAHGKLHKDSAGNDISKDTNVSPRLGVIYDIQGNGRFRAFVSSQNDDPFPNVGRSRQVIP